MLTYITRLTIRQQGGEGRIFQWPILKTLYDRKLQSWRRNDFKIAYAIIRMDRVPSPSPMTNFQQNTHYTYFKHSDWLRQNYQPIREFQNEQKKLPNLVTPLRFN